MKGTIVLENPILVTGQEVTELAYDTDEITGDMFMAAEARKIKNLAAGNLAGTAEVDYGFQLQLGFWAIAAVNSHIDIEDLQRMKGYDLVRAWRIGQGFIFGRSEGSQQDSTADVSESTPEPSTPQPERYEQDD